MSVRGRFRASKSAESRRGKCKKVHSPRTPAGPWLLGRAAVDQGRRSVAEDCFEFPLSAEAILRKVAASVPLGCAAAAWSLMGRPVPTDIVPSLSRRSPQEAAASHDTKGIVMFGRREATVGEPNQSEHNVGTLSFT